MLSVKIKKRLGDRANGGRHLSDDTMRGARGGFVLDVEFEVSAGVTILFGASGSGKSTTLKSIAGLVRPDAGRIAIGEHVLFDAASGIDAPVRERNVGYVFQNLALLPHLTALANIEFAIDNLSRRARRQRALELMRSFAVEHVAARRPRDISGGEAQRIALARALARNPQMLLLDEPLSALDEPTKLAIIADLKTLNRTLNLPVIYVTHSRQEAVTLGERVIICERGRVVAEGEPIELLGDVFGKSMSETRARSGSTGV